MQIGRFYACWLSICLMGFSGTPLAQAAVGSSTDSWIGAARFSIQKNALEQGLYELGRAQSLQLNHDQAQTLQSVSNSICSADGITNNETPDEKAVLDPLSSALTLTGAAQQNALKQALDAAEKNNLAELYAYAAGWLGRIYLRENKLNEAKEILSKVGSDTAFTLPAAVALAEAQYKLGQPKKALAIWISLTKRYPNETDSIAAAVYAANTFAALGDEGQALNYFQLARKSSQQSFQDTEKLLQNSNWITQLEQQPEQLGDTQARAQLYDFYARNRGHKLLQALRSIAATQHCIDAEAKRFALLKPALQQQQKLWTEELQQLNLQYAQMEQQIKAHKKKMSTMQEVFHTLRSEEVLPQAKTDSLGEQVERVKEAERKRDPVNNYVSIQDKKEFNLTPYQLSLQSRERQSIKNAQNELVELTHRWLETGQRITELEQKIKRVPALLAATEQKINVLNAQIAQQQNATRSRLISAAQYYLAMKQTQLKTILTEAQMGELSLVDKAIRAGQTTPNASQ